ncbi:MAG TPA: vitamin K epoxide reductase family protein [Terriglobales bacterium]|nr:vitamin K epoxide reductase family protein [Terriglobales bacterium]
MQPAVTESSVASSSGTRGSLNRILYAGIAVLSVAGIIVSAVSLQRHYAKSATQFCDFSQQFSCDVVNRSEYSSIMGIPVAGIGVVGYAVLLALSTFFRARAETPNRLLGAAIAGSAFALYLTYIEAYVLTTWCILCLISLVLIFLVTVLAGIVRWKA